MNRALLAGLLVLTAGCETTTRRPPFQPMPQALTVEVRLELDDATRLLAERLAADSFPVRKIELADGYIETDWFVIPGFGPPAGRPLGTPTDKVRAWVDPGRPGHSRYTLEVIYQAWVDPSRDSREGERPVGDTHTARTRALGVLRTIAERYGDPDELPRFVQPGEATPADTATPARPDTGQVRSRSF